MVQYQVIEETVERKSTYPYRAVSLPRLTHADCGSDEFQTWCRENWWMVDYNVTIPNKDKAKELSLSLWSLWTKNPQDVEIPVVIQKLKDLRAKDPSTFSALEQWSWGAIQMVNYAGDRGDWQAIWSALDVYKGDVLEAFCGHHSYFKSSDDRRIIAIDYCAESLLRYSHPSALRICCDLNQVNDGVELPFLKSKSFDTVSICFGYKYPQNILSLMSELRRVLRPGGKLSFIEGKGHEYAKHKVRTFSIAAMKRELTACGFKTVVSSKLEIEEAFKGFGDSKLYHIEATK